MLLEDTRKPTCYYKNWQVKRKSLSFLWVPIQSIHMVNTQLMWLCFSSTSANKWRRNDRILPFCNSDWNHWSGKTISAQSRKTSLVAQMVKNLPVMQETQVRSLGWEDLLETGMATHSSILSWRTPWTEETGELQSMGLQRVGHIWATFTFALSHSKHSVKSWWGECSQYFIISINGI